VKKPGLGRGLDALIPQLPAPGGRSVQEIGIENVLPNPYQPRHAFNDEALTDLAQSIKQHGVIQPLTVRRTEEGFQLIAGERRLRAARIAGLATVPAIIRPATDAQMLQVALVENLQREDINPVDAAEAYQQLMSQFNATQEEVSQVVGKSRTAIANTLRLLRLPQEIQAAIRDGRLTEGHARQLLALPNEAEMHIVWRKIDAHGLSVRETEDLVRKLMDRRGPEPHHEAPERDPNLVDLEERLQRLLGTRVNITPRREGGTIAIVFTSLDDLNRIVDVLEGQPASVLPPAPPEVAEA